MRPDAVPLEDSRLDGMEDIGDYPWFKERHRIFPAAFEGRGHRWVIDLAAGAGCAAHRIHEQYPAQMVCNDLCPSSLRMLEKLGLPTVSFDIDDQTLAFPLPDRSFDAAIALVTIEHLIHVDHFLSEIHRILADDGFLYISAPNYAAPDYWVPLLWSGKTFHDPLDAESRYEFYAHVRYFTYRTLLELVKTFGFRPDAVYVPLPGGSSRYMALYRASKARAIAYKYARRAMFGLLPPRWAPEPIICLQKSSIVSNGRIRKVLL